MAFRYILRRGLRKRLFVLALIVVIVVKAHLTILKVSRPSTKLDWRNTIYCTNDCVVGSPCYYRDSVDFRILVLTFNRVTSLRKCLTAISKLDVMNSKVSIEIWIDRSRDGNIDQNIIRISELFRDSWKKGRVCIHQREQNAYIDGQWIDTWRPESNISKEIALIVEDDLDISKHSLRWLKAVHNKYDHRNDMAGYSLQMENTIFHRGRKRRLLGPKTDNVFLYGIIGPWGFSPHSGSWRKFQDWFHSKDKSLKPYVPNIIATAWYKNFEHKHKERSYWSMWHIFFCNKNQHLVLFCNLHRKTGQNEDIYLSWNRKETGLHFSGKRRNTPKHVLMETWRESYIQFPLQDPVKYSYEGNVLRPNESFH